MKKNEVFDALKEFAESVKTKLTQLTPGEPEDQLRSPFENFMQALGQAAKLKVVCTGEVKLPGRVGKPDFAVLTRDLLTGYVELKAPGFGANPNRFTGHNREQWKRFRALPNLIYCDGNDWGLYRSGEAARPVVRVTGNIATDGKKAIIEEDAKAVHELLTDFLQWQPIIPTKKNNEIDLKGLAGLLAPLCRMLRDDVTDAMKDAESPLVQLAKDWRQLLFPDASDEQFADAYAQTVTFALLLGRSEKADPLTLDSAVKALKSEHSLLSRALQVLTDQNALTEIEASLSTLIRVIGAVPTEGLAGTEDPWLYFYEDFLAVYDPKLRKDAGVYYTPAEVVRAQVRLIDDLLTNRLGKTLGFAAPDVVTLDPAVGTGTYLLGVIEHAMKKVEAQQGLGAVPAQATALARNIYGFEIMVGPFTVSELRVSRALRDKRADLPAGGTHIFLTDTLESPHTTPPKLQLYLQPIADQHKRALEVKEKVPVIVCLGNPPYDRHTAVDPRSTNNLGRFGGWVRFGDELQESTVKGKKAEVRARRDPRTMLRKREQHSILYADFVQPAANAGHGIHIKNLYNLYVYFWRWALWKVFEHETSRGPGVVSYISASSYLDGDAFCGMREHLRRVCDEIWILDLGGEGRGTRKSDNVFAIQTPVAIAVAARTKKAKKNKPARVHYARIEGTRESKLKVLDSIVGFGSIKWQDCPDDWQAAFRPAGKGRYFAWPLLTDLMPWQHSGCEIKRTWPICNESDTLIRRWRALLEAKDRAVAFKETRDRKVATSCPPLLETDKPGKPIIQLSKHATAPRIERYAYRSLDRQWVFVDNRLGDYLRPGLWRAHGPKQIYLASSVVLELGGGPAVSTSSCIPDRHYFAGRGGKDIFALYRAPDAKKANVLPGLLDLLRQILKRKVSPDDFLAYIYGVLAQPAFTVRFSKELETRELRVPITKDSALFEKVRAVGAQLLWLHTYGERFVPKGRKHGEVPKGEARCTKPIPGNAAEYPEKYVYNDETKTLHVGSGRFSPVASDVYTFEVSGLKVVQSWLKYRMKHGGGKKSSPLDDIRPEHWTNEFTTELLELLWVLEATLIEYPKQAKLLAAVVKGPCFNADDLPPVPDAARKPPSRSLNGDLFE